jgi:hypothetical protein
MAFQFVPLQTTEQNDLIKFLVTSFQADPQLNSFRPEVIDWKYFAEHPEWSGPRSLAVKQAGEIVAHGGIWPVTFETPRAVVRGIHLNDWIASRAAVGAGVYLLKKAAGLIDAHFAIGGSQDTRKLLPKLGYRRCGELRRYVRVIRPWLLFRTTPNKNWKAPLKLLRNATRALKGMPSVPSGWEASRVSRFPATIESCGVGQTTSFISPRRTAAGLNYLLNCPAARFSGFLVSQGGRLRGYFLLTQVGGQVRIAEMRMDTEAPEAWNAMCAVAAQTAAENPEACEIVAGSSIDSIGKLWLQANFTHRITDPIFCYDPRNLLNFGPALDLNVADCDFCLLNDPASPYLS